jgi:hypothetical protein
LNPPRNCSDIRDSTASCSSIHTVIQLFLPKLAKSNRRKIGLTLSVRQNRIGVLQHDSAISNVADLHASRKVRIRVPIGFGPSLFPAAEPIGFIGAVESLDKRGSVAGSRSTPPETSDTMAVTRG